MAQRSRFFDSSGGDRIYTSDAWAQVLGAIIGDGVVAAGNELAVAEASPPAMSVRVNTGKAFIGGYYFEVHTGQEARAIGKLLEQVGEVDDVSITEAVRLDHDRPARVDGTTLARVGREREEAGRRPAFRLLRMMRPADSPHPQPLA